MRRSALLLYAVLLGVLATACSGHPSEPRVTPRRIDPPAESEPAVAPSDAALADAGLDRIQAALPEGWMLESDDTQLRIRRTEKLWSLHENRINAPPRRETEAEHAARIKQYGEELQAELVYRIEPRWTATRVAEVSQANTAMRGALAKLPEKHEIEKLRHEFSKQPDTYRGKTPEEKERIAAFESERAKLEGQIQPLPDCHTDRYSLFEGQHSGLADAFHVIHPAEAGEEVYAVLQEITRVCKGGGAP